MKCQTENMVCLVLRHSWVIILQPKENRDLTHNINLFWNLEMHVHMLDIRIF